MTSKNIAIREDVYRKLLEGKKGEESFSDAIARLLEGKSELLSFAGLMSDDKEFERAMEDLSEVRKKTVVRE
jgi:predicted CopG family antitoxin